MRGGLVPIPVPDAARDARTPNDVLVTMEPRAPDLDPSLGVAVPVREAGRPKNRLVVIGDSLSQGFQSGAIFNTQLSYPAIIAWEMGWDEAFRRPTYEGFGGLPVNIEYLIRHLEGRFGDRISWWETPSAAFELRHLMAQIEDWWERGPGSHVPATTGIMHNLAVYGWDLRDALSRDAQNIEAAIKNPRNDFIRQIVENAPERAAMRVYNSARDATGAPLTLFQAAAALGEERGGPDSAAGIETLLVFLGANNALGAVAELDVKWSDVGFDDPNRKNAFTVWRPSHFAEEFGRVVAEVKRIEAQHVIFGNVPHMTIAPIARGVDEKVREGSRYFPYYTRPWIADGDFDPDEDAKITGNEARAIDSAIDQYNDSIAGAVREARRQGLDWYVLDVAGLLDRLATRRYIGDPQARPDWWTPYELPPEIRALQPVPDTRFFCSGPSGRTQGGLFSLDGIHPTTIAYGILAQEFIHVMQRAGVKFYSGDGVTERTGPVRVDFGRLCRLDTLIHDPPRSLESDIRLIGWIDQTVDVIKRIFTSGTVS